MVSTASELIPVTGYGATGDGSTDDTSAAPTAPGGSCRLMAAWPGQAGRRTGGWVEHDHPAPGPGGRAGPVRLGCLLCA